MRIVVKSPFRYPGAKGRMVEEVLLGLLVDEVRSAGSYCEPFVGGGSVALAVASKAEKARLYLNDADPCVAAFWEVVSTRSWEELRRVVRETVPSVELHCRLREDECPKSAVGCAYRALFLNRTSFSGIIGAGPIGGMNQKSRWKVGCRWNSGRLCAQIERVHELLAGRATVTSVDFREALRGNRAPCYLDPPYWVKGRMCYPSARMDAGDHVELRDLLCAAKFPWVLSYDACDEVRSLYAGADVREVGASYSISGSGRRGWVGARELVIVPAGQRRAASVGDLFAERSAGQFRRRVGGEESGTGV